MIDTNYERADDDHRWLSFRPPREHIKTGEGTWMCREKPWRFASVDVFVGGHKVGDVRTVNYRR